MAEKIRKTVLHVDFQNLINALELLDLAEVENEILAQFAIEASKYSAQIGPLLGRIKADRETVKSLENAFVKTRSRGNEVMKMMQLAVQLRESLERE